MNTATDPFNFTTPGEYFPIAIKRLFPSPTQPRKRFDEAKLKDLAESIKMQGVLQPILVRKAVPPAKKAASSAVKKTEAKKVPTPTQAAQAPDSGATEKTEAAAAWPFPEPSYTKETPGKAKRKAAVAA